MRVAPLLAVLVTAGCLGEIPTGDNRDSEADAGVRQPDASLVDVKRLLGDWSGCMTIENFTAANMATAWGSLAGTDQRICQNCHADGAFGYIASKDEAAFFAAISQRATMMSSYFRIDAAANKVIINTVSFESANKRPGHPRFNPTDNPGMTALRTFYDATAANTACGPSKLID